MWLSYHRGDLGKSALQQASCDMSIPDLSYMGSGEALTHNNIDKDGYTLGRD